MTVSEIAHRMVQSQNMALLDILKQHPRETLAFIEGDGLETNDAFYMALYQHWESEMPYGVMKGRTETPDEWMGDRLYDFINNPKKGWEAYKFFIQLPRIVKNAGGRLS